MTRYEEGAKRILFSLSWEFWNSPPIITLTYFSPLTVWQDPAVYVACIIV
jgi:hypothetical protein